jgi:hypothetical protein
MTIMSDEPLLPPRLTLLGEAMRPVLKMLEREIDRPIQPSTFVLDMKDILPKHMDALSSFINRLDDRLNRFIPDVVSNETATDAEVYRAVGRLEALLEDMIEEYQGVLAMDVHGGDEEVRDLLAGVYRHTLDEVGGGLQELIETLADPMATIVKRGLPTTGSVELPLVFTLTAAPQLAGLADWVNRQTVTPTTPSSSVRHPPPARRSSGLGFWGMVGAVVLGWGIGAGLFGEDDCDL